MLLKEELYEFFTNNSLTLECEKSLHPSEIDELFLKAHACGGRSLSAFVRVAVINSDVTGINPCFRSWEDLYDAYCCFMVGYMSGAKQCAMNN